MTHQELLNKLAYTPHTDPNGERMHKALRAVVELHKPCEPVSDDKFVTCETCNYEYFRESPWPCDTIQAIEKELA